MDEKTVDTHVRLTGNDLDELIDAVLIVCAEYGADELEDGVRRNQQIARMWGIMQDAMGRDAFFDALDRRMQEKPDPRLSLGS